MLVPTLLTHVVPPPYTPASWRDGTDAEIVEALQKHYAGEINIHDYWAVGDERTVTLSAIPEDSSLHLGDSHIRQDVTFILLNEGGKYLSDGETECAFVVGLKYVLKNDSTQTVETGCVFSTEAQVNYIGWERAERRTWCNTNFREAIPTSLRSIFKEHINHSNPDINGQDWYETLDYFELPCEKELLGTTNYSHASSPNYEADMPYLEYYQTSLNRWKIPDEYPHTDPDLTEYKYYFWLRTAANSDISSETSSYISYNEKASSAGGRNINISKGNPTQAYLRRGIAPQGCI